MQALVSSLFSLVKYNNGFFKSEKQASFLLGATGGSFAYTSTMQFGEYAGKTSVNSRQVTWAFVLDSKGVQKITKTTESKGSVVFFERTEKFLAAMAAKKENAAKEHNANLAKITAKIEEEIKTKEAELKKMVSVIANEKNPAMIAVLENLLSVNSQQLHALKEELLAIKSK